MITPKFKNPPVVELVFGVLFSLAKPLKTADVGLYWGKIRHDYPHVQDAPSIPPQVEVPFAPATTLNLQINMQVPLRRSMFFNEDRTRLVQVQEDRFFFNWKRPSPDAAYPSYDDVSKDFFREFETFKAFLGERELLPMAIRQFELSYVNLITDEMGLGMVGKTGVLIDHVPDISNKRLLPEPSSFNWNSSYDVLDHNGRLHVSAYMVFLPQYTTPVLRLDITARGVHPSPDDKLRVWFDSAHEWITCGFADSTSHVLHEMIWKRQP